MTISLLSLQSRGSTNPEAAKQLAVAANRVAMIARIRPSPQFLRGRANHRIQEIPSGLRPRFFRDGLLGKIPEQIVVGGIEINLPAVTAIPLGFIASELITNAAKYGKSRIVVRLEPDPRYGCALSVSNDGPALPEGFDPGASQGLGMKIIQSFTRQIGGELRIGRGDDGEGACFTVLFS